VPRRHHRLADHLALGVEQLEGQLRRRVGSQAAVTGVQGEGRSLRDAGHEHVVAVEDLAEHEAVGRCGRRRAAGGLGGGGTVVVVAAAGGEHDGGAGSEQEGAAGELHGGPR
jgi:hypothetical protein